MDRTVSFQKDRISTAASGSVDGSDKNCTPTKFMDNEKRIEALPESLFRDCGIRQPDGRGQHQDMIQSFFELSIILF